MSIVLSGSTGIDSPGPSVITASSTSAALTVTQTGTGHSLLIQDVAGDTSPVVVDTAGNVGIGTSTPASILDVEVGAANGSISLGRTAAELEIFVSNGIDQYLGGTIAGSVGVRSVSGSTLFLGTQSAQALVLETNSLERARIDASGNMGIGITPTQKLHVSGNILATGEVTAYSDERLKKDWEELPKNFVEQLSYVKHGTYSRTDTDLRQVGVSAQSLQTLMPEAVLEGEYLSVSYGNAALAACVALAKEVTALKAELAELRSKL